MKEKKLKMEDVNKRTIDLDLIDICWISLSRWVRLSSYSLDDSLFHKEKWLRHTTRKNWSSVWSKCLIHYIRRWKPLTNLCLRKTSCLGLQEVQKMERNTTFYGACYELHTQQVIPVLQFSCWSWLKMYDISYKIARIFAQSNSIARAYLEHADDVN